MWCYIPPNQQVFCKYMNFSLLTKCLRGRMEMTSWAFYTWNDFVTPVYDEHRTCAPSVVHWHAVSIVFRTPIVVHRTKWSRLWGTLQGLAVIEAEKGFHHVIRLVVWSGEHFKAIAFCLQSAWGRKCSVSCGHTHHLLSARGFSLSEHWLLMQCEWEYK